LKPNAVGLKTTCPYCGEEVEIIVTKKQIKALAKGFKYPTPSKADLETEKNMHIDYTGRRIPK